MTNVTMHTDFTGIKSKKGGGFVLTFELPAYERLQAMQMMELLEESLTLNVTRMQEPLPIDVATGELLEPAEA